MTVEQHSLSIGVIAYRAQKELLLPVWALARNPQVQQILLVNVQGEQSLHRLFRRFPQVTYVALRHNPGYGRVANLLSTRFLSGPIHCLMNADVLVPEFFGEKIVQWITRLNYPSLVSPVLMNIRGALLPETIRPYPRWLDALKQFWMRSGDLQRAVPYWSLIPDRLSAMSDRQYPVVAPIVAGACLIGTRAAWQQAGYFPSQFHLYGEDVVLSQNAWHRYVRLFVLPDLPVIHWKAAFMRRRPFGSAYHFWRSIFQWHWSMWWFAGIAWLFWVNLWWGRALALKRMGREYSAGNLSMIVVPGRRYKDFPAPCIPWEVWRARCRSGFDWRTAVCVLSLEDLAFSELISILRIWHWQGGRRVAFWLPSLDVCYEPETAFHYL